MAATIQTIHKPTKARALDTSGNNNHGQIYSGRALEFDGVTDYLDLGEKKTLVDYSAETTQANRAWTVACWINIDAIGSLRNIIGEGDGISSTYICVHSGGKLGIWDVVGADWRTGNTILNTNTWYRAAFVFDGDETVSFYLNGVADGSGIIDTASDNADLAFRYIGRRSDGSPRLWNGKLADLQLWQGAFSADDALYDYNNPEQLVLNRGGTSLTESNLKAWYPMNDGHRGQQSYILDASNTGLSDNLVVDGNFPSSDNWTLGDGMSINNNLLSLDGTQTDYTYAYQQDTTNFVDPDLMPGTWKIVFTIDSYTDGSVSVGMGGYNFSSTFESTGTHTVYIKPTNVSSNSRVYFKCNANFVGSFSNIEVYKVNNKNHATTVFYGDEQISATNDRTFAGASNWTNAAGANAFNAYDETTSGQLTLTPDDVGDVQYCYLDGANWEDADGDGPAMVEGRTYQLTYDMHISSYTKGTLRVGMSTDATPAVMKTSNTYTATNGSGDTYTRTFVYVAADHEMITIYADANTVLTVDFDNFSLKEVGTATGWTDADQQLDIPQTALQSYNQLAWFDNRVNGSGLTDYIVMGDNAALDVGTGDFSVSCWFYMHSQIASGSHYLFRKGGAGAEGYAGRVTGEGKISCNIDENGGTPDNQWTDSAAGVIVVGKWYHVVFSYDRSGDVYCYLNGERITSGEFTSAKDITGNSGTLDNSTAFNVGASSSTGGGFPGVITELALFKGAGSLLTQAHAEELYNDGKALDATTHSQNAYLTGYWRNNGLSTWTDLSGSGNNGTVGNVAETMLITAGVDGSRDSQGFLMNRQRTTNSLNLRGSLSTENGEGDYVNTNNKMSFAEDGFTLSFWVKYTDLSGRGITGMNDGNDRRMYIGQSDAGADEMLYGCGDGYVIGTTNQITEGKWHHVLTTYDGGSVLKCYFDGVYDKTKTDITFSGVSTDNFWIGSFEGEQYVVRGFIDDVLIYTDVKTDGGVSLTETAKGEIARIYNAGKRSHR